MIHVSFFTRTRTEGNLFLISRYLLINFFYFNAFQIMRSEKDGSVMKRIITFIPEGILLSPHCPLINSLL